jgi:chromosome segregation ATPase
MGLSRETVPDIDTLQIVTEIAQALVALVEKPGIIAQAARDAYALPEQEIAKASAARADIKANQDLVAQNQKILEETKAERIRCGDQKAELARIQKTIDAQQSQLNKDLQALKDSQTENNAFRKQIDAREDGIRLKESSLSARIEELDAREASLNAYESSRKVRAAPVKELTAGL